MSVLPDPSTVSGWADFDDALVAVGLLQEGVPLPDAQPAWDAVSVALSGPGSICGPESLLELALVPAQVLVDTVAAVRVASYASGGGWLGTRKLDQLETMKISQLWRVARRLQGETHDDPFEPLVPSAPRPAVAVMPPPGPCVEVVNVSGNVIFAKTTFPKGATVRDLQKQMREAGISVAENDSLLVGAVLMKPTDLLPKLEERPGEDVACAITFVKAPPVVQPPPVAVPSAPAKKDSDACGYCGSGRCDGCCLTASCLVQVMDELQPRKLSEVSVGDFIATGAKQLTNEDRYRRITRIWKTPYNDFAAVVELSPGCRITGGHPLLHEGKWMRADAVGQPSQSWEAYLYSFELEGHVDTVLLGGVVCACLGAYCGPSFGWNVFTRKTTVCDLIGCTSCEAAVHQELDFDIKSRDDLHVVYKPY